MELAIIINWHANYYHARFTTINKLINVQKSS